MRAQQRIPAIVVVGVPRSGTTWVGRVLSEGARLPYRFEPDNERLHPLALRCKRDLHRFPYLGASDEAPGYERLWESALCGWAWPLALDWVWGRPLRLAAPWVLGDIAERSRGESRSSWVVGALAGSLGRVEQAALRPRAKPGGVRLVKTVHAVLALEWLAERFTARWVVVARHPFAVAASSLRLGLPDAWRDVFTQQRFVERELSQEEAERVGRETDRVRRLGHQLAALTRGLERFRQGREDVVWVEHEALCRDPAGGFERLFGELGLEWTERSRALVQSLDQPGGGFAPKRVAADEIGKYRRELGEDTLAALRDSFADLGLDVDG